MIYITVVGNVVSHLTYMYLHSSGHFSLHHMLSRDIAVRYITIVLNKTTVLVLCSLHQTVAFRLAWYRICMDLNDKAVLKLVCCIDLCKDKVDVLLGAKPCDVLFVIAYVIATWNSAPGFRDLQGALHKLGKLSSCQLLATFWAHVTTSFQPAKNAGWKDLKST